MIDDHDSCRKDCRLTWQIPPARAVIGSAVRPDYVTAAFQSTLSLRDWFQALDKMTDAELANPKVKPRVRVKAGSRKVAP